MTTAITTTSILRTLDITIRMSESPAIDDDTRVESIADFNRIIRNAVPQAPKGGGYHKTWFKLRARTDDGGETSYEGRIDIDENMVTFSLARHIKSHCHYVLNESRLADMHESAREWFGFARVCEDARRDIERATIND